MPIYAYRCGSCGFENDVLQKISDAPLTRCPQCSKDSFAKKLTAPGFQLKGGGWYATDFKNSGAPKPGKADKSDAAKPESAAVNPPPCQGGTGSCACNP